MIMHGLRENPDTCRTLKLGELPLKDAAVMVWIITIYLFLSVAIAITGAKAGVLVGLTAFSASFLAVVAAGGLKFGLFLGDRAQKIGVPIVAVLLLTFAYWLSGGFSVQLFGVALSGEAWAIIGGLVGLVCVPADWGWDKEGK
jgi:hypothetical protein